MLYQQGGLHAFAAQHPDPLLSSADSMWDEAATHAKQLGNDAALASSSSAPGGATR